MDILTLPSQYSTEKVNKNLAVMQIWTVVTMDPP